MSALITEIGTILTSVLGWLTGVLTWVVGEPLIVFFIALGLAGAMIRWARRVVHF